jgi:hypothetical protein
MKRSRSRTSLSATPPPRPILVLDENFPEPLVAAVLQVATPSLTLQSWKSVGSQVGGLDDASLVDRLSQFGYNALVTCDYHMLNNPEVLAAMKRTNFTVIGCKDVGHDPVRATGLLLYNLEHISRHYRSGAPQPWLLASRQSSPRDFNKYVSELESRLGRKLGI